MGKGRIRGEIRRVKGGLAFSVYTFTMRRDVEIGCVELSNTLVLSCVKLPLYINVNLHRASILGGRLVLGTRLSTCYAANRSIASDFMILAESMFSPTLLEEFLVRSLFLLGLFGQLLLCGRKLFHYGCVPRGEFECFLQVFDGLIVVLQTLAGHSFPIEGLCAIGSRYFFLFQGHRCTLLSLLVGSELILHQCGVGVECETDGCQLLGEFRRVILFNSRGFVQIAKTFLVFVERKVQVTGFEGFVAEILELVGYLAGLRSLDLAGLVFREVFIRVTSAVRKLLTRCKCFVAGKLPTIYLTVAMNTRTSTGRTLNSPIMVTSWCGLSFWTFKFSILRTMPLPSSTSPKTTCLPSR